MRNTAAQARNYALDGINELSGVNERSPAERLDKAAASLRGLAGLISAQRPVDCFDPDGLATMLNMVADEVQRASYIAQMVDLHPRG
ncbi:MAG: hypothetical protein MUE77_10075 [Sandarakinorhabdus sp.]|jgi:hypothetical protein|nr:hypothetical protein [Sandarakinorhabdus sp.]